MTVKTGVLFALVLVETALLILVSAVSWDVGADLRAKNDQLGKWMAAQSTREQAMYQWLSHSTELANRRFSLVCGEFLPASATPQNVVLPTVTFDNLERYERCRKALETAL